MPIHTTSHCTACADTDHRAGAPEFPSTAVSESCPRRGGRMSDASGRRPYQLHRQLRLGRLDDFSDQRLAGSRWAGLHVSVVRSLPVPIRSLRRPRFPTGRPRRPGCGGCGRAVVGVSGGGHPAALTRQRSHWPTPERRGSKSARCSALLPSFYLRRSGLSAGRRGGIE